jgi:hypothetical protein
LYSKDHTEAAVAANVLARRTELVNAMQRCELSVPTVASLRLRPLDVDKGETALHFTVLGALGNGAGVISVQS